MDVPLVVPYHHAYFFLLKEEESRCHRTLFHRRETFVCDQQYFRKKINKILAKKKTGPAKFGRWAKQDVTVWYQYGR